ncbi:MAG: Holliday junction resolvase RuvX [Eggerthellaceae bacterium]|nr:Holliday junction resolvase RuvX [Eggerthellaceae bacterium]
MRVLALDIGKVRTGIAVSDPKECVASPACVLPTEDVLAGAASWKRVLEDWEPDVLLAGLPLSLDGKPGSQARRIRAAAEDIAASSSLPIEFADERLSSAEAKRSLHESGLSEREMRGKVDMIAACLFLQAWLDEKNAQPTDKETGA